MMGVSSRLWIRPGGGNGFDIDSNFQLTNQPIIVISGSLVTSNGELASDGLMHGDE